MDVLISRIVFKVILSLSSVHLLGQLFIHDLDLKLLLVDLKAIHLFHRSFGILISSELNYSMTFVSSGNVIFWEFDALNLSKGIKPL